MHMRGSGSHGCKGVCSTERPISEKTLFAAPHREIPLSTFVRILRTQRKKWHNDECNTPALFHDSIDMKQLKCVKLTGMEKRHKMGRTMDVASPPVRTDSLFAVTLTGAQTNSTMTKSTTHLMTNLMGKRLLTSVTLRQKWHRVPSCSAVAP